MAATSFPLEIERKYLIRYPNLDALKRLPQYSKTEITQTYLKSENPAFGGRIRKRGTNGVYVYTRTYKRDITPVKRIELEEEITQQAYNTLLTKADPMLQSITKVRYCFSYAGKLFELDIYPFWSDRATLEIELASENESFTLPPFLTVIKEVTGDLRYRNRNLALHIVNEPV